MKKQNNKIYELRLYSVNPKDFSKLIDLWKCQGKDIISKYMSCIGVWSTESGQLNNIYHLYEWNSFEHRESARYNFYNDIDAKEYVEKVKPLYLSQESHLLKSLPELFNHTIQ